MKKKLLSFSSLLLGLSLMLVSCGGVENDTAGSTASTEEQSTPSDDTQSVTDAPDLKPEPISLDGKKILFIGNSFIYYGQTVLEKKQTILTQSERENDQGYFYQLCKANGENVSVTNWTFGAHSLDHLFGGSCSANRGCDGVDHAGYLVKRDYDYVVISASSGAAAAERFEANIEQVTAIFRAANPDVKFVYLCHSGSHGISTSGSQPTLLNHLKVLDQQGFTVVDWGKLVTDIIGGKVKVPGVTQTYDQNTFIIRKSATDGYHPSQMSGYITSLMLYCAITGRSAVGQPYGFCNDSTLNSKFDFASYIAKYYTYQNATTNYPAVFVSAADIKGIQELVDAYLSEKSYLKYGY